MKEIELKAALKAGYRQFLFDGDDIPFDILEFGDTWVRYQVRGAKYPMSTNIRSLSFSVSGVYTEKSPDSASGQ